jgi:hypothetical protein
MKPFPQRISPALRTFASLTLAFWFTAQILCLVHCSFGAGGHETSVSSKTPSCHACKAPKNGIPSTAPTTSTTCLTLKSALIGSDLPALTPPNHLLYILASIALGADANVQTQIADRQLWRAEPIDTHEVSLGSAHLSLAPPLFA